MTIESTRAGALTRGQTVFMVAALVLSVASFMLNATMLSPAIRDINTHLGHNAFGPVSSYFYLAGAIGNVAIGLAAFATSLILKPRTAESGLSH
jgi:hypothetical protein